MPDLMLRRVSHVEDQLMQGVLIGPGGYAFAVTLELPWRDNSRNVSAIPGGRRYRCVRVDSPSFGITFEITGVPGRDKVLLHIGNFPKDTRGCVLVGHGFDKIGGQHAITQSRKEFDEFMSIQAGVDEFWLIVESA